MGDIGLLGTSSHARDINESGQVVGDSTNPSGNTRALFCENGAMRDDIGARVSYQWTIYDAVAINDQGQIAATGCLAGSCSADLLSPIPEPKTPAILMTGLAALGLLRQRVDGK